MEQKGRSKVGRAQRHQGSGVGIDFISVRFHRGLQSVHVKDRGWTLLPLPPGKVIWGVLMLLYLGASGSRGGGGTQDVQEL